MSVRSRCDNNVVDSPPVLQKEPISHMEMKWLQNMQSNLNTQLKNRMGQYDEGVQLCAAPTVSYNEYGKWCRSTHSCFIDASRPQIRLQKRQLDAIPKASGSSRDEDQIFSDLIESSGILDIDPKSLESDVNTAMVQMQPPHLPALRSNASYDHLPPSFTAPSPSFTAPSPSFTAPSPSFTNPPSSYIDTECALEGRVNTHNVHFTSSKTAGGVNTTTENRPFTATWGNGSPISALQSLLSSCPVPDRVLIEKNKEFFGHNSFRPGQMEVVKSALWGKSVFCIMPTGGGKSLCYQLPAVLLPGVTVVISPLISLVQDQVEALRRSNIEVGAMLGSSGTDVNEELWRCIKTGEKPRYKLIYTTPEKLNQSPSVQRLFSILCEKGWLSLYVIDEAHCMSQWGHDFRLDYKQLGNIRAQFFPSVPLMALTATATATVKQDILRLLGLPSQEVLVFQKSFNRPELYYEIRKKSGHSRCIKDIVDYITLKRKNESGIIYCGTQKNCEKVCSDVQEEMKKRNESISIWYYHAGMEENERLRIQNAWSRDEIKIIVATVAFGMGINKADVRFVIHYQIPHSLTHYYQESGRAGRDGKQADCILYYSYADKQVIDSLIDLNDNQAMKNHHRQELEQIVSFCINETECRRCLILRHFSEVFEKERCGVPMGVLCDNCKKPQENITVVDVTAEAQAVVEIVSAATVDLTMNMVCSLLRGYTNALSAPVKIAMQTNPFCGKGKHLLKEQASSLITDMINKACLVEVRKRTMRGYLVCYIQVGPYAAMLQQGQIHFSLLVNKNLPVEQPAADRESKRAKVKNSNDTAEDAFAMESYLRLSKPNRKRFYEYLVKTREFLEEWVGPEIATVLTNSVVEEISYTVPTTKEEFLTLERITPLFVDKYGKKLLDLFNQFIANNKIPLEKPFMSKGLLRMQQEKSKELVEPSPSIDMNEIIDILSVSMDEGIPPTTTVASSLNASSASLNSSMKFTTSPSPQTSKYFASSDIPTPSQSNPRLSLKSVNRKIVDSSNPTPTPPDEDIYDLLLSSL